MKLSDRVLTVEFSGDVLEFTVFEFQASVLVACKRSQMEACPCGILTKAECGHPATSSSNPHALLSRSHQDSAGRVEEPTYKTEKHTCWLAADCGREIMRK
jgi:hypothetical protein